MRAGGGQADDDVARGGPRAVDDAVALHHADAEAGEVVVVAVVHAGHLGGLAADERGAREFAAFGDAADDGLGDVDAQFAGGVVVEEEQRLGARHRDVVGAHRDEVDADLVVTPGVDREAQLGADAIRARHQHRPAIAIERHFDQRAEAADAGQDLLAHRLFDDGFDAFDEFVARVDIDAGIAIGQSGFSHVEVAVRRGSSGKNVRYCSQCAHSPSVSSRWVCSHSRIPPPPRARCASSKPTSRRRPILRCRPRPPCASVLVRATGARDAANDPALAGVLAQAQHYVIATRPAAARQQPTTVIFDGAALERDITAAGRTVWGSERPVLLVVLTGGPATGAFEIAPPGRRRARCGREPSRPADHAWRGRKHSDLPATGDIPADAALAAGAALCARTPCSSGTAMRCRMAARGAGR